MNDIKFGSLKELYNRIKPALITKKHEMYNSGIKYITEQDIWQYLCLYKWQDTAYLSLHEMVDDVLNISNEELDNYFQKQINMSREKEQHE